MSNLYSDLRAEYINEWRIWYRMCKRCNDSIRYYVEVSVCDEWQGPQGFVNWLDYMGPRPSLKHCIDRINKFGDYEPGNVEWTSKIVSNNRQRRHQDPNELSYWRKQAIANGINRHTFYSRVREWGWTMQDAAMLPASTERYAKRTV